MSSSAGGGLDPRQLRDYVVQPALEKLGLPGGLNAEMLVIGTAAQESGFRYLHQIGKGPALSLWQIEPATARDALARGPAGCLDRLCSAFNWKLVTPESLDRQLPGNLLLAAAMCRLIYYLKPFKLPIDNTPMTVAKLAHIWKLHYNTPLGAGTEAQFIANWQKYIGSIGLYDIEGG